MARVKTTKASTDVPVSASVPVPVEQVQTQSQPQSVSEVKAPKVKKVKAPKQEAVPVEPVAPVVPVVESDVSMDAPVDLTAEADVNEVPVVEQSVEFLAKLQQISALVASLKTEYRALEKKWNREIKTSQKLNSRRKRKSGNRAPSGFVKPTRISDELASFLGKDKGTEMARTSVTRDINAYIRTNNLQDKENGRKINPDAKLASLLKLQSTDVLTYFNLQRFMSPHFAKSVKAEVATA